jgi:hypothetical protein
VSQRLQGRGDACDVHALVGPQQRIQDTHNSGTNHGTGVSRMSSADSFKIEVDDLLAIAPHFDGGGQALVDYLNQAATALQGLGPFWGNDKPGTAYAATYQKIAAEVILVLTKAAEDLEGVAQGITAMAAHYGQTEADITTTFHGRGGGRLEAY